MKYVIAYTTTDDKDIAESIANAVVENRLGACVQVQAIKSIYRWKKHIVKSNELLLKIKTTSEKIEDLKKYIVNNHNYEVPEFIVVPILEGYDPYMDWIKENT